MEIPHLLNAARPRQLDWRWVDQYRELDAYDAYWWWAATGPFTQEEQQQWNQLFTFQLDEASKHRLGVWMASARDRELEAALAEHREPQLHYPALDITEVRRRIAGMVQLDEEIGRHEPSVFVRWLYHGAIEDEVCFLRMIEATYEGNNERFKALNHQLNPPPTSEEMQFAFSRVRQAVIEGLRHSDTADVSQQVIQVMQEQWHLSLDLSSGEEAMQAPYGNEERLSASGQRMVSAHAAQRFFETKLLEMGLKGWQVSLDPNSNGARVESAFKRIFLQDRPMSLEIIREYFAHEVLGHVLRSVAGERSQLGLLGINTKGYSPTEEGLALYYERTLTEQQGERFDDSGTWFGALAVGLASGVITPPQTLSGLYAFFQPFILLHRLLWHYDKDRLTAERLAHKRALTRCLRTYRGVPDLTCPGACYTKDVVYLRGRLKIERAVAEDATILDRLTVGKVALELLPELEQAGIVASSLQPLWKRAHDPDIDAFILSFEESEEPSE